MQMRVILYQNLESKKCPHAALPDEMFVNFCAAEVRFLLAGAEPVRDNRCRDTDRPTEH
jgi:hypothetical protein